MNDTTFSGNGKVSYIPVITGANPKPITNADRIRQMSDEELAEKWLDLVACTDCPVNKNKCDMAWLKCSKAALDWLKNPVEVDE